MKLGEILKEAGRSKRRKRVGRGNGSGHGKTSCRGHKGRGQRSGVGKRMGYEGGQNPVVARLPKRGFSNYHFRKDYQIINVGDLDCFDADTRVDANILQAAGMIDDTDKMVKILGNGELNTKLTVVASKFSAGASEKIAQAGGTVEVV
ncbi:MAG: 50S ribosomal protein L15 [Phycisphaerales bacterium]|jgi:large subunit ribosomal protein L15|nr:50S ribosomal protein L15 [Phycisphaerales bacterium]